MASPAPGALAHTGRSCPSPIVWRTTPEARWAPIADGTKHNAPFKHE
jgi:hypothetical protein